MTPETDMMQSADCFFVVVVVVVVVFFDEKTTLTNVLHSGVTERIAPYKGYLPDYRHQLSGAPKPDNRRVVI